MPLEAAEQLQPAWRCTMNGRGFDELTRAFGQDANRRSVFRGLAAGALALIGNRSTFEPAAAQGSKTLICHRTGRSDNPYVLIEVSSNAVAAHEKHDDHRPYDCFDGPSCSPCTGAQCFTSTVGLVPRSAEYGPNDPWTVCRADADSAWLSSAAWGQYDPVAACQSLGYRTVGGAGGTCEHICGYCGDAETSCENPGTEFYDYQGGYDPDYVWCSAPENTDNPIPGTICNAVVWECLA
jgi:hypothetical protein